MPYLGSSLLRMMRAIGLTNVTHISRGLSLLALEKMSRSQQSSASLPLVFYTARDAWTYNYSHDGLASNMRCMIDAYNEEVERYKKGV
ncbi:type ISP restriction/modification enzyme [Thauera humireducens]|uniref:type ISP restriction/modification enzyme n=1 Tax=Thauera humireducens TaxID=1134435 RepID=UPI003C76BED4